MPTLASSMEQRVRNLEDLCELITKEIVEQNKSMIEMNKNLINEIKCLREAYVKQDVSGGFSVLYDREILNCNSFFFFFLLKI